MEMMIISFLFAGWTLSWFKFEEFFIQALKELFNKKVNCKLLFYIFLYWGNWRFNLIFQRKLYNQYIQLTTRLRNKEIQLITLKAQNSLCLFTFYLITSRLEIEKGRARFIVFSLRNYNTIYFEFEGLI